ncbi:MAG: hypothetical protein J6T97_01570 [Bacteroidaceae bacterium]|nr:hypothetical protein [Bacteroidaceae bacterium]
MWNLSAWNTSQVTDIWHFSSHSFHSRQCLLSPKKRSTPM